VKGRIDPKIRIRKLDAVDLWEISIVTFPLLAGARVRAVKESPVPSRPISFARARAEKEWKTLAMPGAVLAEATRAPRRIVRRRPIGI
jgi:phage head maturation protease